ncbi:MAG TPA: lipoprotein-releasing ABC transporter ATP-binding protein LolD [Methylococcaceae bacterium]|jgi:lipoprotein-releasing system ATP-binding protein|nr:lipoprotein-releasing ABC transporter ATP-binding protein LolD [Methylococcaceae bacterium]HIB61767.1 lipoprotein-releasing ABC transporter ATP-binding protein LolD [Methylococcaceae bacterium]HIN67942.1 lipoprotein-releasing ABC transporter ATP-binding protein LolD [Methylococcales bacterium]HIO12470.1 lipoprotein-releasing ABC transporter ATP-binding protein LolD [Methylococcales bacterium]HIO43921.1 lipoprotein-releasing ABC transporter ATP-binding protein LolD [Methylococcales bacterium]
MSESVFLETRKLVKYYRQGELNVSVLKGIDLIVNHGDQIAIMGPSGSGKSTLLHLLGGLDEATSGDVLLGGVNIQHMSQAKLAAIRNKSLGFIYQFHHLLAEFDAVENVAMPLLISGSSITSARKRAIQLLERVGLGHRLHHKPAELSGGERQRVAVARALINNPQCILADEPTGNLDSASAEHLYQLMARLNKEMGVSLLIVTHDKRLAERMDTVLQMEDGLIKN